MKVTVIKRLTNDCLIDVYHFKGAVSQKEKEDYININIK
ncbi:MAG: hypothetical protein ACI9LG_003436 [Moritella dasanensis]|jgi:hypothetical protein